MTHTARARSEANIYHVTARGIGKQLIFENDADKRAFVNKLKDLKQEEDAEIYAWCLMENHIHLLIHADIECVSRFMKRLLGGYGKYFNTIHERTGHLFQDRFHSVPVNDDGQLLATIRYVHLNPTETGVPYSTYPWSSYGEYLGIGEYVGENITSTDFVRQMIGSSESFERMHEGPLDDEDRCKETEKARPRLSAGEKEAVLERVLCGISPYELKSLDKQRRNEIILSLWRGGLSIRQIERTTGIGKRIIETAVSRR